MIPPSPLRYHSNGAIPAGAFYVERLADGELLQALLERDFCYVSAPQQIGKSSLCFRTAKRLRDQGVHSVIVSLGFISDENSTLEQWYCGVIQQIIDKLRIQCDSAEFWQQYRQTPFVQRFVLFLRQQVLEQIDAPVVIFLDEINSIQALPFSVDEFFAAVHALYDSRAEDPACERLSFCLMGFTALGDLIRNPTRVAFEIGRDIHLDDFTADQAQALLPGLASASGDPERLLATIFDWTNGHPFMIQRICSAIAKGPASAASEEDRVRGIVEEVFLNYGPGKRTEFAHAERRLRQSPNAAAMLKLYRRLLREERVPLVKGDPVQIELRLCGLAAERLHGAEPVLRVRNRVFATVFDQRWAAAAESTLPGQRAAPPPVQPARNPTKASLRKVINLVLLRAELDAFCLDYFEDVYKMFATGMERTIKLNLLLEHKQPLEILVQLRKDHGAAMAQHEPLLEYDDT